jgi:hypothetical protein
MDKIDLQPYGIRMVLRRGMSLEYEHLNAAKLSQGSFSLSQGRVDLASGTYSIGSMLGEGTYGKTYQIIHMIDNHVSVLKTMRLRSSVDMVKNSIKEAIINLVLERESEHEPNGPYVPRFYELAFDPHRNLVLMRIERIHGDLESVYQASTPEQNDIIVPETVADLAHVLNFFHKRIKYNHRDMKANNVGYVYTADGKYNIKLIDFGMSCLTWKGVQVSGEQYFPITDPCFIPSRDLTQYIYEIHSDFRRQFSVRLQTLLQTILTFPLANGICKMFQGCTFRGREVRSFHGTYDFLNRAAVKNPQGVPTEVYRAMLEFLGQAMPKQTTPVTVDHTKTIPVKRCLPEQIFNPKTRRCVKRDGAIGRRLMKESERRTPTPTRAHNTYKTRKADNRNGCKEGQSRNPITNRCRKSCDPSELRNPATGRCVSRKGAVGKRLKAEGILTSPR